MLKKLHIFILIGFFGLIFDLPNAYSQSDQQNGTSVKEDDDSRIVHGKKVAPRTYPFICSLQKDFGNYRRNKFCAGTLIDKHWIVTAAHCTEEFIDEGNHDKLRALCGTVHADKVFDEGVQYLKIKNIFPHPEYDNETAHNDISLLEIDGEIRFSQDVSPACLPPSDYRPEKIGIGKIMGWGATDAVNHSSSTWNLLDADGIAMSYKKCQRQSGWPLIESQFCVTHRESQVCNGDSGGPYVQIIEPQKKPCIIGIASYGFPNCGQLPSVFTKVSAFLPFIMEHLRKRG